MKQPIPIDSGGSMKAKQVKAQQPAVKTFTCDVCKIKSEYPYGYTRRGRGSVCCRKCDEKYRGSK